MPTKKGAKSYVFIETPEVFSETSREGRWSLGHCNVSYSGEGWKRGHDFSYTVVRGGSERVSNCALHSYHFVGFVTNFYAVLFYRRFRHAKVRLAALEALWVTVKVPDRAKVKGAGTAAIVDLVGFREDNVLPIAAFYGKGDTTINYLAEVKRCFAGSVGILHRMCDLFRYHLL